MTAKKRDVVAEALAGAKRLESLVPHDKKQILQEYRDALAAAAKLQKLLKPAWYLKPETRLPKKKAKSRKGRRK
jgi:hypothetical protein